MNINDIDTALITIIVLSAGIILYNIMDCLVIEKITPAHVITVICNFVIVFLAIMIKTNKNY